MTATAGTTVLPAIAPDSSDEVTFRLDIGLVKVSGPKVAALTVAQKDDLAAHVIQRLEGVPLARQNRRDSSPIARLYVEARGWLTDCGEWRDMDAEDIAGLTEAEVRAAVGRHYVGGWASFMEASEAAVAS